MHSDKITFSQPLNERLRYFMRLEFLFQLTENGIHGTSIYDSHLTLCAILELMNFVKQQDIKREVLHELERVIKTLSPLQQSPDIQHTTLQDLLDSLTDYRKTLLSISGPIASELREIEFLKTVQQRNNIPGGLTEYDPPVYSYWLKQPAEQRHSDLKQWLSSFSVLQDAIKLILKLVRESATPIIKTAENGVYQQSLDSGTAYKMVYVSLPADTPYFAEISGGKHRFTIRFLDSNIEPRPFQTTENVEFELYCCIL